MNELILHSFRRCPFAMRVRMVLEEKNLSYKVIEEDLSHFSKELLELHPEGRVPLLIHHVGGVRHVVYQSTIITEYLDDAFPKLPLMPVAATLRAQVRLLTYWCDTLFKPDLDLYKYELKTLDEDGTKQLIERLHVGLNRWNQALAVSIFLVGDQLTLADIHLFPFARQFMAIKHALPGLEKYEHWARWLDMMVTRPAFERVMKK